MLVLWKWDILPSVMLSALQCLQFYGRCAGPFWKGCEVS